MKEEKEQKFLKKLHDINIKTVRIILNALLIIMCLATGGSFLRYLMKQDRTSHDGEQMLICGVMFCVFAFILWLEHKRGAVIFGRFLKWIADVKESRNKKDENSITTLNTALHMISQKSGVVIWDTLWSVVAIFFALCLFIKGSNKPLILGIVSVSLVMLFVGHYIGIKLWKRHHFEKRILKYTKQYLDIEDESAYIESVDRSVQRGVLCYAGLCILTDEYMIGRLSDISFEAAAIPRDFIVHYEFYYYKKISSKAVPVGVLQCLLLNGKRVKFEIGRGEVCGNVLKRLSGQKIFYEEQEMKYGG